MTQSLRDKLGEQGTAVLSVHPGPMATDMVAGTGMDGEPPSIVGEGIVNALANGDCHFFAGTLAGQLWGAYEGFAKGVVEADLSEG